MTVPVEPAVWVRDLEKRFGAFAAVDRVSFEVFPGEIFGFLGPNGAGKSTTIRMLCGVLAPSGGAGAVAGHDIRREPERIKERIGYMSQRFSLYEDLTVEENLDFFGGIYGLDRARRQTRKAWAKAATGLLGFEGAAAGTLAAGRKQRLALACAVLHEPSILFLDEPTSGVDPLNRRRFWDLISELAAGGVTVFVTTHTLDEAEYCGRLGLIYRGELVALGSPGALKASAAGAVFEVRCPRPLDARPAAEAVPGVLEASVLGGALRVLAAEPGTAPRLAAALAAAGFGSAEPVRVEPTLEEVFVSLIGARDRAAGALKEVER